MTGFVARNIERRCNLLAVRLDYFCHCCIVCEWHFVLVVMSLVASTKLFYVEVG